MDPRTKAQRLILRGYGPLAGLVVVLLFLTLLVPSRPLSTVTASGVTDAPAAPVPVPTEDSVDEAAGAALPAGAEAVTGTTMVASTSASSPAATSTRPGARTSASGPAATARAGSTQTAAGSAPGTVAGKGAVTIGRDCSGGTLQDGNSPYSPPCLKWNGTDNGGATSRGVTNDTITVV
ncbi:MAG: hypothetical protein LC792_18985, partial [Actinobacteria bacterium]|nr:hypothetical protein [Actinomycetota bacterium]